MANLRIKQITLPSGNTYQVYDENTRLMITSKNYTTGVAYSAGDLVVYEDKLYRVSADITAAFNTDWSDLTTTVTTLDHELDSMRSSVSGIMKYYGVTTTVLTDGATISTIQINGEDVTFDTSMSGYVVISGKGAEQKEYVWSGTTWNEFGSTGALKALAFKDSATGTYDKTTGASVNMTTVNPTVSHLAATASGGAVSITNTAAAITGFGTHSKTNFVTSYPGTTSKLATTTVSKATAGTAINVAKTGDVTVVANGALGAESSLRGANTPMWGASVTNETLSFTFKPLTTEIIIPAADNGTITPYTFADVTVATGSLSAAGAGDSVMTGLGTANTSEAITDLGTPTTADAATAITMSTQPTITLATKTASDSTTADVVTAVSTGTTSTNVTLSHTATSITVQ